MQRFFFVLFILLGFNSCYRNHTRVSIAVAPSIDTTMPSLEIREREDEYSIGLFECDSNFQLKESSISNNPILCWNKFRPNKPFSLADPFLINDSGRYYIFYEISNLNTGQGDIALAESMDLGKTWNHVKTVVDEPFHLSFPCVFKAGSDYYLVPESAADSSVRLYKATRFPYDWKFQKKIIFGKYVDNSLFYYHHQWWMFSSLEDGSLHLFYSSTIEGKWNAHPQNPLIKNDYSKYRAGGKVLTLESKMYRIVQCDTPYYGHYLRAFQINKLSNTEYEEAEIKNSPILVPSGNSWRRTGMHQLDGFKLENNRWLFCADGYGKAD